jgi:hypothetical protein
MEKLAFVASIICLASFTLLSVILIYESANKKRYFRAYLSVKGRIRHSVQKLRTRVNFGEVKKAA